MQRLVIQSDNGLRVRNRYFLEGKPVTERVYRDRSSACTVFDCHQTVTLRAGVTRFYSCAR